MHKRQNGHERFRREVFPRRLTTLAQNASYRSCTDGTPGTRPEPLTPTTANQYGMEMQFMKNRAFLKICVAGLVLLALATPVLSESLSLSGQNIDAINAYNNGSELAYEGKFQEALNKTDEALTLQPGFALAWTQKAGLLVVLGNYSDAVTAADKAIELNPNISEAWASRADALNNLGKYEEALASGERSVEIDPSLAEGWANTANALINLGRFEEAANASEKALAINPGLPAAQTAHRFATAVLEQAANETPITTPVATQAPLSPAGVILALLSAGILGAAFWRKK